MTLVFGGVIFSIARSRSVIMDCDRNKCAAIPLGKSFPKKSLYSSNLSSLLFLASSTNFCCLCHSSLSWAVLEQYQLHNIYNIM
jgi:hypothetical protein